MKTFISISFIVFSWSLFAQNYSDYFTNERLRIDYYLTGNANKTILTISKLFKEPIWAGSKKNLVDTFYYGHYRIEVYDSAQKSLLFASGFCTLYQEWQQTPEAKKTFRTFSQFVNIPFPKNTIKIIFLERNNMGTFHELQSFYVNPSQPDIIKEKPNNIPIVEYIKNGDYNEKIDIAIIAEGYTAEQMDKFIADAKRLTEVLFTKEPFNQMKSYFNVTFVKSPSLEEGTDKPHLNIWKKTAAETRFYTFSMDRYLSVYDYQLLGNILNHVAYDQLVVLVNTKTYGGGGIYNFYSIAVSDNVFADYVFIHEFGHAFGALGDEYQDADDANENFYNLSVEPWEPNITTLVNFDKKWKKMLDKKTPIPTPIKGYENKIGVFEGAGYKTKGIYRPSVSCIMRDFQKLEFCPVCQVAIKQNILFHTGH
ncbi:MAG: IgA Peptidase M64 [Bacteroidales bacterium]|nr:IgA Peptidase M64 [Bacteroidales bacterium]